MTAGDDRPAEQPAPTADGREVHIDVDPDLEPLLAALYGPTWRRDLAGHLAGQLTDRKDTAP